MGDNKPRYKVIVKRLDYIEEPNFNHGYQLEKRIRYPEEKMYEQIFEELDLVEIIKLLNKLVPEE